MTLQAPAPAPGPRSRLRPLLLALVMAIGLLPSAASSGSIWDRDGMEPYRLPLARKWLTRAVITRPHHDYPATDIYVPYGTKSFSVQAGKVRATLNSGACGIGVVIDGFDGYRYTYCHGSEVFVHTGQRVKAGQPVFRTGSTGSAWGRSHLHLEIEEEPSLTLVCPQPLMLSWWRGGQKTAKDAPYGGCSY